MGLRSDGHLQFKQQVILEYLVSNNDHLITDGTDNIIFRCQQKGIQTRRVQMKFGVSNVEENFKRIRQTENWIQGPFRIYLRGHGDRVDGKEIRAMVPVNLRPLEQAHKLGNRFGLAPVVLPIGMDNPIERIYEVRRRMGELKGSMQPLLAFGLLAVAGLLIKPAQDAMLNLFSRKTTAVMTNVPGPREKVRFLGATVEQNLFWVPQSGTVGLGVSILSYGGGVQFGVITDGTLCPDPQKIIDGFAPEFAKLSLLTLMLPWGE